MDRGCCVTRSAVHHPASHARWLAMGWKVISFAARSLSPTLMLFDAALALVSHFLHS